jgi:hypothetical protein
VAWQSVGCTTLRQTLPVIGNVGCCLLLTNVSEENNTTIFRVEVKLVELWVVSHFQWGYLSENRCFYGGEDADCGLLGCATASFCRYLQTFLRKISSPFSTLISANLIERTFWKTVCRGEGGTWGGALSNLATVLLMQLTEDRLTYVGFFLSPLWFSMKENVLQDIVINRCYEMFDRRP